MAEDKPTYEELENRIKYLDTELSRYKEPEISNTDSINDIDFEKIFNIDEIQRIQDLFAEATGVASIITYPSGIPITKPSNFCRLCNDIIRKTEKGLKNCYHSDAVIGKQNIGNAIYQPCLSGGLWDGGASISVGGKHIANWLIGQIRNENIDENKMLLYAKEIGADEIEFKKALDEVSVMPTEKFKKIVDTLYFFANEISQKAYQNILQGQLIAELQKKEDQLIKSKEKAEESDRLKTAFLQNMSHEIRTPMNAIMGFSRLLVDNYNDKAKLEKFSEIINQRCSDLLEIINDILDISKIESGQLSVNLEYCNIIELFTELNLFFKEYQKRIGKQHLNFSLQFFSDKSFAIIQTDKLKLKQILINLISNAFKFTEYGSIDCGCKLDNNQLVFYVSDTGIGIPQDKHDKIFERFSQLHHSSLKNIGGTGLGLSIAKGLTGLLGGKIWIDSEPDKGTTFHFTINYIKPNLSHQVAIDMNDSKDFNFQNKTILIVEDDIYNIEYLKEILANKGFNIIITEYGKESVQIAKNKPVDLILMDIRLPDLNGYDATRLIKLIKPHIKIIAQTAYAAQDERQKAIDAGCIDYISKPIKRELLLTMINKYLTLNQTSHPTN